MIDDQQGEQITFNVQIDTELRQFLDRHPEFVEYIAEQFVEVIDEGIDSLIVALSQCQPESLQYLIEQFMTKLLSTKTRYVQYVIFPLMGGQQQQ